MRDVKEIADRYIERDGSDLAARAALASEAS